MADDAPMTQFEGSKRDKDRKGEREGSKAEEARDAKQSKRMTLAARSRYYKKAK